MTTMTTPLPKLTPSPNKPVLLCLDLGTTTGWALSNANGHILHGTLDLHTDRFCGGGMRYLRFVQALNDIHTVVERIDAIYFEEVRRHLSTNAAQVYGGFLATLSAWAEQYGIAYQGVPVGTIKKFIAGKGNASKAAVMEAVRTGGQVPEEDNAADALALLHYVRQLLGIIHQGSQSHVTSTV